MTPEAGVDAGYWAAVVCRRSAHAQKTPFLLEGRLGPVDF